MRSFLNFYLIALFLTLSSLSALYAQGNGNKCDSLVEVIRGMGTDDEKVKAFADIYYNIVDKNWKKDFITKSINDITWEKKDSSLLRIYRKVIAYSDSKIDHQIYLYILPKVKELSYKHKDYSPYFDTWRKLLVYDINNDKDEKIISQIELMEKEARKLNFLDGVISAKSFKVSIYKKFKKYKEAINLLKEIKEADYFDSIGYSLRFDILNKYASESIRNNDTITAFQTIKECEEFLNKWSQEAPKEGLTRFNQEYIYVELLYCEYYKAIKDYDQWYVHLEKAKQHINPKTIKVLLDKYYILLSSYYFNTEQWEKSLESNEMLLEHAIKYSFPLVQIIHIKMNIASGYLHIGKAKQAAKYYEALYNEAQSSFEQVLEIQNETIINNNLMKNALMVSQKNKSKFLHIILLSLFLVIIIVCYLIFRLFWFRKRINRNYHLVEELYNQASENNKQKEKFIKSIRDEIKSPLESVVNISETLTNNEKLDKEKMADYYNKINQSCNDLLITVNGVLDMARIESGMAKYTIERFDIVSYLNDIISKSSAQHNISFTSQIDSFFVDADKIRFQKIIQSLLGDENPNENVSVSLDYHIKHAHSKTGKNLKASYNDVALTVSNSPLYRSETYHIQNDINRQTNQIVIKMFKWQLEEKDNGDITIYIPESLS